MYNTEILAPAGSVETLYAGINAGADAIYIGGQKFGARAYADNPETDNLLRAIDYAHLKDKKIYMTVNTLLKNQEIEEQLYDFLKPYYEQGLDAVIVQDLGVFDFVKKNFPLMDIHASTQMGISGVYSARLLKELGATRVVTARELSLKELKEIHDNVDIEIESFIHGAMCYSYSGMCLFSSIAGGRSGNRGRCAGPCRQPYEVYRSGKRINDNDSIYALSLKDMNTLHILPEIIESGVYSLKIEGRMKSPEYAAGVVSIYRKYVDKYYENGSEKYSIDKKDDINLANLYTRSGSKTGYYKNYNSRDMISYSKPAYESKADAFVDEISKKYCSGPEKIKTRAYVTLVAGEKARLDIVNDNKAGFSEGEIVCEAQKRPLDDETILKQLNKTGDSFFEFEDIEIYSAENVFMPVKHLNDLRRNALLNLSEEMLSGFRREKLDKIAILEDKSSIKNASKNSSKNNNIQKNIVCQVSTKEQADILAKDADISDIYVATDYLSVEECTNVVNSLSEKKNVYIVMPYIFRKKAIMYFKRLLSLDILEKIDGLVVRNIDELAFVLENGYKNFVVDSTLYAFNNHGYAFFKEKGANRITLPYELNFKEIRNMENKDGEVVVYGNIPLMISSNCVNQNFNECDKISKDIVLKDRLGYEFLVNNCCNFCYNIIYNMVPMSLMGVSDKVMETGFNNFRINFSTEKGKEVVKIIDKCKRAFYNSEKVLDEGDITRGHFKRGVE